MEKFALPLSSFEFNDHIALDEIMKMSADSDMFFVLDVGMIYSDHIHDQHLEPPTSTKKIVVSISWQN